MTENATSAETGREPMTAADWFSSRRSGGYDEQAFMQWITSDPAHADDYADVEHAWRLAGALRDHPDMLALREQARNIGNIGKRVWWAGLAASILIVASMAGVALWRTNIASQRIDRIDQVAMNTRVGEQLTFVLRDGSRVTLDTDSMVVAAFSDTRRRMELLRGRAHFAVAKDRARPFIVEAGEHEVTATGTAFDEVTLIEGSVFVADAAAQQAALSAGQRLIAQHGAPWQIATVDVGRETRWREGRLAFDNQPLAHVVSEINRYSERKIVIGDDRIILAPVVGVFDANDPEQFVGLLSASGIARVATRSEGAITLVAP
jgi:transmembrane sensor